MVKINNVKEKYYIYWHLDPRTDLPVYAGKGKGDRAWDLYGRNNEHKKWVKELTELGLKPIILIGNYFESEEEVYAIEKLEIAILRNLNCKMHNIAAGGFGGLGEIAKLGRKAIICLNTEKEYNSTVSASEDLNIPKKRICDVLKGRKKSYKGYKFRYVKEELNEGPQRLRAKKEFRKKIGATAKSIVCNETGKVYVSSSEAAREIGISNSLISRQLNNKAKHAKGFTFKRI